MTIYDHFRQLAGDNEPLIQAIGLLEGRLLPDKQDRRMAHEIWRAIVPPSPPGRQHSKDSFWGIASARCIWKGLYGYKCAEHSRWLTQNIHRAGKCVFVPIPNVPQPRVGIW